MTYTEPVHAVRTGVSTTDGFVFSQSVCTCMGVYVYVLYVCVDVYVCARYLLAISVKISFTYTFCLHYLVYLSRTGPVAGVKGVPVTSALLCTRYSTQ